MDAIIRYLEARATVGFVASTHRIPGAWQTIRDVRRQHPDRVLLSAPPHGSLIVAAVVLALLGYGIVLDFRDGWSANHRNGYGHPECRQPIKGRVSATIERLAVALAQRFIVVTPGLVDYYAPLLGARSAAKLRLLPNGHRHPALAPSIPAHPPAPDGDAPLTVACAGKFAEYGRAKAERALAVLGQRYRSRPVSVRLIGSDPRANAGLRAPDNVTVALLPRLPVEAVGAELGQADLGLLLLRDPKLEFGTKIFDYLAAGVPVLDIWEGDEASEFKAWFAGVFDTDWDPRRAQSLFQRMRRDVILAERGPACFPAAGTGR